MTTTAQNLSKPDAKVPVVFERAIAALAECRSLDEAKTFDDAAEALAAWARIYTENEAGRQAKQLRLHAYRRMGVLASELSPLKGTSKGGRAPGPIAKLKEHGLSKHGADAANVLGKMGEEEFDLVVNQDIPPAPTSVAKRIRQPGKSTFWHALLNSRGSPFSCAALISKRTPEGVAALLDDSEKQAARMRAENLIVWLQAFLRAL